MSVVYIVDEMGAANRYDIGVGNIMWGPDFPHSSSSWPVDYQLGREILERAGATPSEIERIMWRNAADTYKMPYDEPATRRRAAAYGRASSTETGEHRRPMTDSNDYRLISADSHVLEPPDLFERPPGTAAEPCSQARRLDGGDAWMVDGSRARPPARHGRLGVRATEWLQPRPPDGQARSAFADVLPGLYDPAERLRAQDADSVQAEVLYPSAGLWDADHAARRRGSSSWPAHGPTTTGSPSSRAHNPDRLIGLGKIPSTTCEDARDELLRCVKELNLRGVHPRRLAERQRGRRERRRRPVLGAVNESGCP